MHIFVDFLGTRGIYRAADDSSWVDPALPISVLTGSAFLEAAGEPMRQSVCALYHVERRRIITERRFGQAGVLELDTIVVVNTDDSRFASESAVDALWWRTGGAQRRLVGCAMPTAERAAANFYAN